MRIVHIIIGLNTGGAELALKRIVFNDSNNYHSVVSLTTIGSIGEILRARNVEVVALGLNKYNFLFIFVKLICAIHKLKPDIIQTWMYHSDFLGGLAAIFLNKKNICWNIRNTDIPQKGLSVTRLLVKTCAFLSYVVPQKIICCAHSAKNHHIALGFNKDIMVVIPNGYEINHVAPASQTDLDSLRNRLCISSDSIVIGMVGRFDTLKGYDLFIRASQLILNSDLYSNSIIFLCIGRDVDYSNGYLKSLIDEHNVRKHFILIGEVSNIESYYALMDIFCLASRSEGFPNVLVEAMIASLPCVATDAGDSARILGGCGVIVARNSASKLAYGLTYYLSNAQKRRADGVRSRARAIERYGIASTVRSYDCIYKTMKLYEK